MRDTIYAPATAHGHAAVAVVRLSGPRSAGVLETFTGRAPPPPRRASLRRLRDRAGLTIDDALVLWFPGPASYTGEDGAELHLHGGPAVVIAMLDALKAHGLRLAEPGEFTRRAFEHGRLDLTQAEAVADLVAAETPGQHAQALAQMEGGLSRRYAGWGQALLDTLALLEAAIDFPDEDLPETMEASALARLRAMAQEMEEAAADVRGERVRDGVRIALIGAPNVGKSSLLNALARRDAAIVTSTPGTTRDVVEASLLIGGQLVRLADTAGLRPTDDVIEAEGVRRARSWAEEADLRIGVVDQTRPETADVVAPLLRPQDIMTLNKSDIVQKAWLFPFTGAVVQTHASREGVSSLHAILEASVRELASGSECPAVTQARHRDLLSDTTGHLRRALQDASRGPELAAENVRLALRSLERIVGRFDPDAVLDRVLANFCIGK